MATDAEKTVKDFVEATNSNDMDKAAHLFTDDFVYEDVAQGVTCRSKKELIDFFNSVHSDLPDHNWEVKSIFSAGDRVAFESVWSGTHTHSSNPERLATGKYMELKAATIVELRSGKISRVADYYNRPPH